MASQELFANFWDWRMRQSPEFSSLVGLKQYNDSVECFTEKRFEEDLLDCKKFLETAEELLKVPTNCDTILNLQLFIDEISTFIDGYKLKGFYFPMNYMEGVHVDFERMCEWVSLDEVKDYDDLLSRYRALPNYCEQTMQMMKLGMGSKLTNHLVSMKGVAESCKKHYSIETEKCVFYQPFINLNKFSAFENERLRMEAMKVIEKFMKPAFLLLAGFVEKEYMPACRPGIAVSSLPGVGAEFYKACIKFHTSTSLTADEIHEVGLKEVARIEEEMKKIITELKMDLSLKDFTNKVRCDKSNFFNSKEELLEAFSTLIHDRITPKLGSIFSQLPVTKLEISETPLADYPAAFYLAGTADGARPGKLLINTHNYASQPKYELVSLALHEANPGHHLQSSYNLEKAGLPQFRKVIEDRIYSQAPSRFPVHTAYIEGWALYCETLGLELGFYEDPMDRYGHLSEESFRACRLVVDTGMHAKGWSMDKAIEFMLQHSAATKENIQGEVSRYVTWPGQALGYKIGQLRILALRRRAQDQLGSQFDIKKFHDMVLNCAGPLQILEQQVDQFIQNNIK